MRHIESSATTLGIALGQVHIIVASRSPCGRFGRGGTQPTGITVCMQNNVNHY